VLPELMPVPGPAEPPPPRAEPLAPRIPWSKRSFDVVLAAAGLLIVAPLFALIALLVKLTSPGPVFFRQVRCGTGGDRFEILKFRKMGETVRAGDRVTARGDFRLTPLGRVLERTKLDELPQLINVLRGEMSIVGPRPEDPTLAAHFPVEFAEILTTPPGVAGPNQVRFRNESELYPEDCADRTAYYVNEILPRKIPVDLAYVRRRGFFRDLLILLEVILVTVFGLLPIERVRERPILVLHLIAIPVLVWLSLTLAFLLRFGFRIPPEEVDSYIVLLVVLMPVQLVTFLAANSHNVLARYYNVLDLRGILITSVLGTGVGVLVSYLVAFSSHSRIVLLLHASLLLILGVLWMSAFRQLPDWFQGMREDILRRIRITAAYGVLGVVALGGAVAWVDPDSVHMFEHSGAVVMVAFCVNAIVFFLLEGYDVLNRTIRFSHQFGMLKITVASTAALYGLGYMLGVVGGVPRAIVVLEIVFKYTFILVTKYLLARAHAAGPRGCKDDTPTVLVGTLAEADALFSLLAGSVGLRCIRGIVLVGQYHAGLSIHSIPILAEVARARDVVEQLEIGRVIALDAAYEAVLRDAGITTPIVILDPEEEVDRQRRELESDRAIQAKVAGLRTTSKYRSVG
jgi:lipopolysaccharide/colanic/teichoic acid biosynthesis glycosyltransferase